MRPEISTERDGGPHCLRVMLEEEAFSVPLPLEGLGRCRERHTAVGTERDRAETVK